MTTGVLDKHLLVHHPKKYNDFLMTKEAKEKDNNKRKGDEFNEMENKEIPKTNL